tara:strand:- start:4794 stop:5120 length:327 start_codon:yes stop_codon:yes gene_type:complete
MENLTINLINKCYYCDLLKELLKKYKIDYNMVIVPENNKNKYKDKNISTFPQVYYHYKKKSVLIGGYTEFLQIINNIIDNLKPKDLSLKTSKKNKVRIYLFLVKQLGI